MSPGKRIPARAGHTLRALYASFLTVGLLFATGCATTRTYTDPDALRRLVADRDEPYILVDVRTPEEYSRGHIPTSINIPVISISESPLASDRSSLVIVYCGSGMRSATAARRLRELGFRNVVDFGAISRWKGPLEKGGGQ